MVLHHRAMSGHILRCNNLGERVLLASRGRRPGLLLNILQHTGQPLQQRMIWPQMSGVLRLRNPDIAVGHVHPALPSLRSCYEDKREEETNILGNHKII